MKFPVLGLRLRDRLGPEASQELSDAFKEAHDDMLTIAAERYEARLSTVASELRQDMARMETGIRTTLAEGFAKIRTDMSEMRVDVIRWSFVFWIGQVIATATVVGVMLRSMAR